MWKVKVANFFDSILLGFLEILLESPFLSFSLFFLSLFLSLFPSFNPLSC